MTPLPLIVGFGGVNPAGRVSFHHSFRRTVIDALPDHLVDRTFRSLCGLMGLEGDSTDVALRNYILDHTLIRRIEAFDPDAIAVNAAAQIAAEPNKPLSFVISRRQLPETVPDDWDIEEIDSGSLRVRLDVNADVLFPDTRASRVTSAGELPTGFDPSELYPSRSHPRGLEIAIYGASDAVRSTGLDWELVRQRVSPDEMAVFAASCMTQVDSEGNGGLLQAPWRGSRPSSKQAALGLAQMPADFVNAYVLGSLGCTGGMVGACATFLYNLRLGVEEIRNRRRRVAIVGAADATVTPEVIEGYRTMRALAEDDELCRLDGSDTVDNRRACRPFSSNAGFTMAESSVYVVLMDDELALEIGAEVYGSVADVYVNADGFKKSISSPGIGNYVTVGKALGLVRSIVGDEGVQKRTFVHAHGTGTPQNRTTESHILNEFAKAFRIEAWPVAAVKAYLGHTLGPASGDQLTSALGTWSDGIIPGIKTIDHLAEDVHSSNLHFPFDHIHVNKEQIDAVLVNSKGFGGNNATGVVLSPSFTNRMLESRHGAKSVGRYRTLRDKTVEQAAEYDEAAVDPSSTPIYKFGEDVLDGTELSISDHELSIPGFDSSVSFDVENPYQD